MEVFMNHTASPFKLSVLAVSEWLLVLPAALLLAAAALRQLQPAEHEPARTISMIFSWVGPRISHFDAALLFLGLPGIAAIAGCVAILVAWRKSETLRQDAVVVLTSLRRNLAVAILGTGTLLAGAILAAVIIHIITD
jgi:hypothetical protein